MTDREWRASCCVLCYRTDPDEGWHERCGCHEIPTATNVSAGQDGSIGVLAQARETPASIAVDRGRGPTVEESNVKHRTPEPPAVAGA